MSTDDPDVVVARQNELRDIHHRIDALKTESERQYDHLIERLHALEVAIASGGRFPASAWVAALALVLTILGSSAALYGQLQVTARIGQEAKDAIQTHVTDMAPAQAEVWRVVERVKNLEGRIVGEGREGWHRRDHDLYAAMMDERNDRLRTRLQIVEEAQAAVCQRIQSCKDNRR